MFKNLTIRMSLTLALAAIAVLTVVGGWADIALTFSGKGATENIVSTVATFATLTLLLVIYSVLARKIVRPLEACVSFCERIATGDLTIRVEANSTDEIGRLFGAIRKLRDGLSQTVRSARAGADSIDQGAREIASGNTDLSARTEQQAASLQETASSMEQLTTTVRQNADNARQASQLAVSASGIASQGGEVVGKVVSTMDAISASSKKVADIIGVIEGIAFQTNILALNAAVEAARAGEQGRGFAVVAGEVRTLAQRSAAAAKEIKELIGDSADKVASGSELVGRAGRTMSDIVQAVQRVTDIMGEISAASEEQSGGIEQVNRAVTQMDNVTQQNAALVEQSAAAAGSLEDQTRALKDVLAAWRLDGGDTAARSAVAPTAKSAVASGARRTTPAAKASSVVKQVARRSAERPTARKSAAAVAARPSASSALLRPNTSSSAAAGDLATGHAAPSDSPVIEPHAGDIRPEPALAATPARAPARPVERRPAPMPASSGNDNDWETF
jgi:methyl-accepting chemotaxis protein I, serine sensor receptor